MIVTVLSSFRLLDHAALIYILSFEFPKSSIFFPVHKCFPLIKRAYHVSRTFGFLFFTFHASRKRKLVLTDWYAKI